MDNDRMDLENLNWMTLRPTSKAPAKERSDCGVEAVGDQIAKLEMTDSIGNTVKQAYQSDASNSYFSLPVCEIHKKEMCYSCLITGGTNDFPPASNYEQFSQSTCPKHGIVFCLECSTRSFYISDGIETALPELRQEPKRSIATVQLLHLFKKDASPQKREDIFYRGSPPDTEEFYKKEIAEYKQDELNLLKFQAKMIYAHYCAREFETVKRVKNNGTEFHTTRNSTPGYFLEFESDSTAWSSMDLTNTIDPQDLDEMQF
jgi:hypothetical protein